MTEKNWKWYAGSNDEYYAVGPCDTRGNAIDEAHDNFGDDVGIHVIEAVKGEVRLRDYIGANCAIEEAEERAYDLRNPDSDDNIFDVSAEEEKDLVVMLKAACDAWQIKHNLHFEPWCFTSTRNAEYIAPEVQP
ncbi:hypothetical protein [Brucella pecoris]|uniref:Uncharacterized protein n=1 Tax=Brucella pecoris TaxID=867683 RepID=A0A5C5CSM5_9HYPH|nr:hypothetical protein [Brucella pecoris]MBB4092650.1 hypothetical protein [Brucella pecoris]TNV14470.1 hypothetical protein FIB18_04365 [Brucella pecoris]